MQKQEGRKEGKLKRALMQAKEKLRFPCASTTFVCSTYAYNCTVFSYDFNKIFRLRTWLPALYSL